MDQEEPELHDGQRPSCDVLTPKKPESTHFMIKEDDYDKTSRPKRRAKRCFYPWASEASWCLVASLLLGLLVFALKQFNGKAQPKWPLGLSLNTLIAFLSTICRCIMVHPIAEGLLQLKWNWFAGKGRPLRDIRLFDKASRSSWASLKLVTRLRGRFIPVGILASLVLVASLGTSFITQSTISYSTRTVVAHNNSAVSFASLEFPLGVYGSKSLPIYAEDCMLRAAERSLIYRIDEDKGLSALEPHCPTANCRWPIFSSLAVCVSMGNVTEYLTPVDYYVILPGEFGRVVEGLNITSPAYSGGRVAEDHDDATEPLYKWNNSDIMALSLARAFFLYGIRTNGTMLFEAVEVVWHYCVNTYNISVTNNIANTELLASELTVNQRREENKSSLLDFTLLAKNGHREFNISYLGMMSGFRRRLATTIVGYFDDMSSPNLLNYNEFTYQIGQNIYRGCMYPDPNVSAQQCRQMMWSNLRNVTETMALAMTNFMRANQVNGAVEGEALESEIFITVRWAWISFLAAQIGLTIAFILAVAASTSNLEVPVIKGSNAAELFAIRKSDMETTTIGTVNGKQAGIDQKIDKKTLGILVRDYDTWHLEIHSKE